MPGEHIDARGLACPQAVVLTKKAIDAGGTDAIRVKVDNEIARENVTRLAEGLGWSVAVQRDGADIGLALTRGEGAAASQPGPAGAGEPQSGPAPRVVVFVASRLFGEGEEELGRILMRAFVKTLKELEPRPAQAIFANGGVFLTTEGSDLLDDLRELEQLGVEIVSCGTCLDYHGLVDKLGVGRSSNMYEIASALAGADRVVRP
ncbi:MAG: sulfurtransferase-like selenium metabolism protein YedF [Planctomycetota bacterium]|jgi:selenium metabolism protein YedF